MQICNQAWQGDMMQVYDLGIEGGFCGKHCPCCCYWANTHTCINSSNTGFGCTGLCVLWFTLDVSHVWTVVWGQVNLCRSSKSPPHPLSIGSIMMVVMFKGVWECRYLEGRQTLGSELWQFWQARLSLVCPTHNVDPRLYQFELLEFYPGLSALTLAYLAKDERE